MREELVEKNPFQLLEWPRTQTPSPDPFSLEERDRLLAYIRAHHMFFYPWIYTQFATGMRPSESTALRLSDVDQNSGTVSISKSRHLKTDALPKTRASKRLISVPLEVIDMIRAIRLPWETGDSPVFYNQLARAITANEWAGKFWKRICTKAEVKHRKFYCTRHTFITEAIRRGENIKAVADYCGTSIDMIQRDYCGRLELRGYGNETLNPTTLAVSPLQDRVPEPRQSQIDVRQLPGDRTHRHPTPLSEMPTGAGLFSPAIDQTEIKPGWEKAIRDMVVPTGVDPVPASTDNIRYLISSRFIEKLKPRKFG